MAKDKRLGMEDVRCILEWLNAAHKNSEPPATASQIFGLSSNEQEELARVAREDVRRWQALRAHPDFPLIASVFRRDDATPFHPNELGVCDPLDLAEISALLRAQPTD